jgi:hypothetical protein
LKRDVLQLGLTDCPGNKGREKVALELPELEDMKSSTRTVKDEGDDCTR